MGWSKMVCRPGKQKRAESVESVGGPEDGSDKKVKRSLSASSMSSQSSQRSSQRLLLRSKSGLLRVRAPSFMWRKRSVSGGAGSVRKPFRESDLLAKELERGIRDGIVTALTLDTKYLGARFLGSKRVLKAIESASGLTQLRLVNQRLSKEAVRKLGLALSKHGALQTLELDAAALSGLPSFFDALSMSKELRELRLTRCLESGIGSFQVFRGNGAWPCSLEEEEGKTRFAFSEWSTIHANGVEIKAGKAFFEVTLVQLSGATQIGWADTMFNCKESTDGVGDDQHSWAFDPFRRIVWSNTTEKSWGVAASQGDVLGCMIDLEARTISYSLNGVLMGVALHSFSFAGGVRPAITAARGTILEMNVGASDFKYPLTNLEGDGDEYRGVFRWASRTRAQAEAETFKQLDKLLQRSTATLVKLDLSFNTLGDEFMATSLLPALSGAKNNLESLDLSGISMSAQVGVSLLDVLFFGDSSSNLKELIVGVNPVGALHQASSSSSSSFGDVVARVLASNPQSLQILGLVNSGLDDEEGSSIGQALASNDRLEKLELSGNAQCGPAFALAFAKSGNQTLRELSLQRCGIDSRHAEELAARVEQGVLSSLDLSGNPAVGIRGIQAVLSALTSPRCALAQLHLEGCNVDDLFDGSFLLGLEEDQDVGSLQVLSLANNLVDFGGLSELAQGLLQRCTNLVELDICGNLVGQGGKGPDAILRVAKNAPGLQKLLMSGNQLGAFAATESRDSFHSRLQEALERAFRALGGLQKLDVSANGFAAGAGEVFGYAVNQTSLKLELSLAKNMLGSKGVTALVDGLLYGLDDELSRNGERDGRAASEDGKEEQDEESSDDERGEQQQQQQVTALDVSDNGADYLAFPAIVRFLKSRPGCKSFKVFRPATMETFDVDNAKKETAWKLCQRLVDDILSCDWGPRAHIAFELLLDVAPTTLTDRVFLRKKNYIWSEIAGSLAHNCLPCLLPFLAWVAEAHPENIPVYRCNRFLNFVDVKHPIDLPDGFHTSKGVSFERCSGDISIGANLHCKRLGIVNCSGKVRLGPGAKASSVALFSNLPGLEEIPDNMHMGSHLAVSRCFNLARVGEGLVVKGDCAFSEVNELRSLPSRMIVEGNFALVSLPVFSRFGNGPYTVAEKSKLVIRNCPMLTTLDKGMFGDNTVSVYLVNTGIGREEFLRLVEKLPSITWHVGPETLSFDTFKSMSEAVEFWNEHASSPDSSCASLVARLEGVVQGYYVRGLLSFLSKLRISKQFEYEEMRQGMAVRVIELLESICSNEAAREELLVRITDSVDSCGDKPVLVLNHCRMQILVAKAKGNPEELLPLGLSLMRLGIVHEHALAKCNTLADKERDDVCVYLRYEIELAKALDLPIASQKMLFPSFVKVLDSELDAAKKDALRVTLSSDAFKQWLETWGPWQEHLRSKVTDSLCWDSLDSIELPDATPDDYFTFLGEPMNEPVALITNEETGALAGPYEMSELVDRFVTYGMDFNNISWQLDALLNALRRVDVGVTQEEIAPRTSFADSFEDIEDIA